MAEFCQLSLTCSDKIEADNIAKVLLQKKLVACVKQLPVNSQFFWRGKVESEKEVLLLMESREDIFDRVQSEIQKLHSYDTFVLSMTPIKKVSADARKWLAETLENK